MAAGYGHHMSFEQFWTATVFGKAFVKAPAEALYVTMLFSKSHLERVFKLLHKKLPVEVANRLQAFLLSQRESFQKPHISPNVHRLLSA